MNYRHPVPERPMTAVSVKATSRERITFGPSKMSLPRTFEGTVNYGDQPFEVEISATFDGNRVRAQVIGIKREDGVTPRDLATIELGRVIESVTAGAVRPDDGAHVGRRPGRRPTDEELRLVADVYWYHHVTGGNPRQAVMTLWDLPRSTANGWLRRARDLYDFPEV